MLRILKANGLPSASEAVGVNVYALPAFTAVGGVPEITGDVLPGGGVPPTGVTISDCISA